MGGIWKRWLKHPTELLTLLPTFDDQTSDAVEGYVFPPLVEEGENLMPAIDEAEESLEPPVAEQVVGKVRDHLNRVVRRLNVASDLKPSLHQRYSTPSTGNSVNVLRDISNCSFFLDH